jgi:thioesterase domain-containing protein
MTTQVSASTAALEEPGPPAVRPPPGAHLVQLREGSGPENLFLLPGMACDPSELSRLSASLEGSFDVHGVGLDQDVGFATVEDAAELALGAIRAHQPSGPYLLGGYSFGGLVALEVARRLTASGETVRQLLLIDAIYGERFWPRSIWGMALARRTAWHLLHIARLPPAQGRRELRRRAGRLVGRLRARSSTGMHVAAPATTDSAPLVRTSAAAIAKYRPRPYPGTITLLAPSDDRHFGCDTTRLWKGLANRLFVHRIDADHLTLMQDDAGAAEVAAAIDERLASRPSLLGGLRPVEGFRRPLVLTTMRWFSAARLANALVEAGFLVTSCSPNGHPLDSVEGLRRYHLNRLWRLRSLLAAVRDAEPDIILCDDERALALLRRLHTSIRSDDPQLAALITHSIGRAEDWPTITSRSAFAAEARALQLSAPDTAPVADLEDIGSFTDRNPFPIVLKTDGSWGGRGVAIVRDPSGLSKAWPRISGPPSLPRCLKRALLDLEAGHLIAWLRRTRPAVNVQRHVAGREASATVACLDGQVVTMRCFEVVQVTEPRGPAAVVRIIDHPGMEQVAGRLVERFRFSGFCGFDFMLTEADEPTLLEVNPRVTPTAYLLVEGARVHNPVITLFPPSPVSIDPAGVPLAGALDVPVLAPALVRRGEAVAAQERGRLRRWTKTRSSWNTTRDGRDRAFRS